MNKGIQVHYIIVDDDSDPTIAAKDVADLMAQGAEILKSWITNTAVHHLISLDLTESES